MLVLMSGHLARVLGGALGLAAAGWQGPTVDVDGIAVRPVEYGDVVASALTAAPPVLFDGPHGEVWMFPGEVGECVTIRLQSTHFAPVVEVRYASPLGSVVAYDGAGSLGWPSALQLQLPRTGTYFIVAKADPATAVAGSYQLALSGAPSGPQACGVASPPDT